LEAVTRYNSLITAVDNTVRLLVLMPLQNYVFYHWDELCLVQTFLGFLHLIFRKLILLVKLDRRVNALLKLHHFLSYSQKSFLVVLLQRLNL
jgi:hypothetical protein